MTDYDYYDCDYSSVIEPWRKYRLLFPIAHVGFLTYRKGKRGKERREGLQTCFSNTVFYQSHAKKAILNLKRMLHLVGI